MSDKNEQWLAMFQKEDIIHVIFSQNNQQYNNKTICNNILWYSIHVE